MKPKSEPGHKQCLADDEFGLGVLALDTRHHVASCRSGNNVHINIFHMRRTESFRQAHLVSLTVAILRMDRSTRTVEALAAVGAL